MNIVIFFGFFMCMVTGCFANNMSYPSNELHEQVLGIMNASSTITNVIEEILLHAEAAPDDQSIFYAYNLLVDSIVSLIQRCPQVGQNYDIHEDIILAVEPYNHHIAAQIYNVTQAMVVIDGFEYILPMRDESESYLVISISQAALRYLTVDELHYLIARELYSFVQSSNWKKFLAPSVLATFITASSVVCSADLQWSLCLSGITGLLSYLNQREFSEMDKDAFAVDLLGNKTILRSLLNKQMRCLLFHKENTSEIQMLQERLDVL